MTEQFTPVKVKLCGREFLLRCDGLALARIETRTGLGFTRAIDRWQESLEGEDRSIQKLAGMFADLMVDGGSVADVLSCLVNLADTQAAIRGCGQAFRAHFGQTEAGEANTDPLSNQSPT